MEKTREYFGQPSRLVVGVAESEASPETPAGLDLGHRDYLADKLSLADIAHAGNFVRLRELEARGEVSLDEYPNVAAWMERLESRESYKAAM